MAQPARRNYNPNMLVHQFRHILFAFTGQAIVLAVFSGEIAVRGMSIFKK